MKDIIKLNDELFYARYKLNDIEKTKEIWEYIKNNPKILKESVKLTKGKFNNDTLVATIIAEFMLMDYEYIDNEAYTKLINNIYTKKSIARIVIDGHSNGGFSFLLMSLWNHSLQLTEEQKSFAVDEAMNKIGTTKYMQKQEKYYKELEEKGITDTMTSFIEEDGLINPIGAKSKAKYINHLFNKMSSTQAHGISPFDIRYHILRNPNWTLEEKQKLIMEFWYNDEEYDETLEEWEWGVVNDYENYKGNPLPPFDKYELFNEYTYEMLLEYYGNEETAKRIWNEIEFCKQMHELRPMQYEKENTLKMEGK